MKNIINVNADELVTIVNGAAAEGVPVRITVVGNSMYPFLRNAVDSAELYSVEKIKRNDVLFYRRSDGSCVLHRCIKIKDGEYIMCGDNQLEREYGIKRENILAAARVFYRADKKITDKTAWYRIYKFLWCTLFCMRPVLCVVLKGVKRIKRMCKRR